MDMKKVLGPGLGLESPVLGLESLITSLTETQACRGDLVS